MEIEGAKDLDGAKEQLDDIDLIQTFIIHHAL